MLELATAYFFKNLLSKGTMKTFISWFVQKHAYVHVHVKICVHIYENPVTIIWHAHNQTCESSCTYSMEMVHVHVQPSKCFDL